jgi:hypothetical protein
VKNDSRRPAADRAAGVDHRVAGTRAPAGLFQRRERGFPGDRQDDDVAESRGVSKRLDPRALVLRRPVPELRGLAGAERDFMSVPRESRSQGLRNHA